MDNKTALVETANCSFTECYIHQELIFVREVQVIFLLLYALVSIMGIVGNLLIVITVARSEQTENVYLVCKIFFGGNFLLTKIG